MADQTKYSKLTETTVAATGYQGEMPTHLVIPAQIKHAGKSYNVTEIGASAFSGCNKLVNISLNGIETVREKAFAGCEKATAILLPDTLVGIERYAFAWCGVEAIKLPSTMQNIGEYAFVGCNHLRGIICEAATPPTIDATSFDKDILKKGILYVHTNQIENYRKAKGWDQFTTIVSIEEEAAKRAKLASAEDDDDDEEGNQNGEDEDEKNLIFTDDIIFRIESEDKVSVEQCNPELDGKLMIPETATKDGKTYRVTSINKDSLSSNEKLKQIYLPANIEEIEFGSFVYCHKLTHILVDPRNQQFTDIDGVLFDKYKTIIMCYPKGRTATSYQAPASIMGIAPACFLDCRFLENVYLFDNIQHIGIQAFYNCKNLRSITLPLAVEEINGGAFYNCDKLESIYILKGDPAGVNDPFDTRILQNATLYVPREDLQTYKKDEEWKKFNKIKPLNIIEDTESGCLYTINGTSNATLVGVQDELKGEITIPNTIEVEGNTYTIDRLGRNSLEDQQDLTEITLPDCIKSIGYQAFSNCRGLKHIKMPAELRVIENNAFNLCLSLTELNLPAKVEAIGDRMVEDAEKLERIDVDPENGQYYSEDGILYDRRGALVAYPAARKATTIELRPSVDALCPGVFSNAIHITEFKVATNNTYFASVDGILTTHDQSKLIAYPAGRKEKGYNLYGSITTIGRWAFRNSQITQITLTNNLTTLESGAFYDCTQLKKISLPEGITTISDRCFLSCNSLKRIELPSTIEKIGMGAFGGCNELSTFKVPQKVTSIENGTFANCFSLSSISLPNGLESIGDFAFVNCPQLTSINFPITLNSIGSEAFKGCFSELACLNHMLQTGNELTLELQSTLPPVISDNTFDEYTYNKVTVIVPDEAVDTYRKTEGWYNFKAIKGKEGKIKGQQTVTTFEKNGFTFNITGKDAVEIAKYTGENTSLTLKGTVENEGKTYRVTRIGESAFEETEVFYVNVEAPIEQIGKYAFANSELSMIHLPNTLQEIGTGAFGGTSIEKISLPNSLRELGIEAFAECHELKAALLPNGIDKIHFHTFYHCMKLETAYIPDSVESIEEGAFQDCETLENIHFGEGLQEIGESAFANCKSLDQIELPENLVYLGDRAFYSCKSLDRVFLPSAIDYIGTETFRKCENLQEINITEGCSKYCSDDGVLYNQNKTELIAYPAQRIGNKFAMFSSAIETYVLPESVKKVDDYAFEGCKLSYVVLPDGLNSIGERSFANSTLEEIELPLKLKSLGKGTFMGCKKLKEIELPSKITTVKEDCFRGCNKMASVKFPQGMKEIGVNAFKGCTCLTTIDINGENCVILDKAFDSCKNLTTANLTGIKSIAEDAIKLKTEN